MSLVEVLEPAAAQLPGLTRRADGQAAEWSVAGEPFAAASGPTAEFLLPPAIGRAALGTPDTSPSSRGPQWIAFTPAELDRFAVDRATAWFASAHRHAGARTN